MASGLQEGALCSFAVGALSPTSDVARSFFATCRKS